MMATDLADQLPTITGNKMRVLLPHTKASFKIQDVIPKSHLMDFKLTEDEMKLIQPEELMMEGEECQAKTGQQKLGILIRGVNAHKQKGDDRSQEKNAFI